jgi:hypothetical protein
MVMLGRFSSDDPGWREPWDRDTEPANDDGDWAAFDPRPRRVARRRSPGRPRRPAGRSETRQRPADPQATMDEAAPDKAAPDEMP